MASISRFLIQKSKFSLFKQDFTQQPNSFSLFRLSLSVWPKSLRIFFRSVRNVTFFSCIQINDDGNQAVSLDSCNWLQLICREREREREREKLGLHCRRAFTGGFFGCFVCVLPTDPHSPILHFLASACLHQPSLRRSSLAAFCAQFVVCGRWVNWKSPASAAPTKIIWCSSGFGFGFSIRIRLFRVIFSSSPLRNSSVFQTVERWLD